MMKFSVSVHIDRDIIDKVTFSIGYFARYIPKISVVILSCRLFATEIICAVFNRDCNFKITVSCNILIKKKHLQHINPVFCKIVWHSFYFYNPFNSNLCSVFSIKIVSWPRLAEPSVRD